MNDKKVKLSLAIIALCFCIFQVQQTYAKYIDTVEGDTNFSVAKWKFKVNDTDITETTTISSLVSPTFIENENIKDGVIAPTSEGYFDLELDASGVEVSFQYVVDVKKSNSSAVSDLVITGYSLNGGTIVPTNGSLSPITNTVSLTDTNRVNTLRVYFTWQDGTGETMDNAEDTEASTSNQFAKINVSLSFVQVASSASI